MAGGVGNARLALAHGHLLPATLLFTTCRTSPERTMLCVNDGSPSKCNFPDAEERAGCVRENAATETMAQHNNHAPIAARWAALAGQTVRVLRPPYTPISALSNICARGHTPLAPSASIPKHAHAPRHPTSSSSESLTPEPPYQLTHSCLPTTTSTLPFPCGVAQLHIAWP